MITCEMCGEDIDSTMCPFCGTQNTPEPSRKKKNLIYSVNIKEDLPTVEVALERVKSSLVQGSSFKAVKIVHGYGSSGRGGVIKDELHLLLSRMLMRSEITGWIPGEEFSGDFSDTLYLLKNFPFLEKDSDHRKRNKGITVIVL